MKKKNKAKRKPKPKTKRKVRAKKKDPIDVLITNINDLIAEKRFIIQINGQYPSRTFTQPEYVYLEGGEVHIVVDIPSFI